MKKHFPIAALAMITLAVTCCQQSKPTEVAAEASPEERGEYLVNTMGCHDCHTPKVIGPNGPMLDTTRLLSGHPASIPLPPADTAVLKNWVLFFPTLTAAVGPWGTSFSANITSDVTGIGEWTEAQFFKALREGKHKGLDGGRPIMPPMPWEAFRNVKDDDLKAIFAYLKSTKPVSNVVPAYIPPAGAQQ